MSNASHRSPIHDLNEEERALARWRAANAPPVAWPEIDDGLLDDGRGAVPPFPIDLLPQPWRDWVADRARCAGAPVDYVAQALLAAVAGVSGAGVEVRITNDWAEPLVLWQALIGTSSSGKSPALAAVRRVLAAVEAKARTSEGEREGGPTRLVVGSPSIKALARTVSGNPRGVLLWRDRPSPWLAELGKRGEEERAHWLEAWSAGPVALEDRSGAALELERFAVSVLGTLHPDGLTKALEMADDGLAARFLYAWPDPAPYCPLRERRSRGGRVRRDAVAHRRSCAPGGRPAGAGLRRPWAGQLRHLPHTPACRDRARRRAGRGVVGQGSRNGCPACRRARAARLVGRRRIASAWPDRVRPGGGRRRLVGGLFQAACQRDLSSRWTHRPGASGPPRGALAESWRTARKYRVRISAALPSPNRSARSKRMWYSPG